MKRSHFWKMTAAGIASALTLWTGTGSAGDQFATLTEVPTDALSQSEMAVIEGKVFTLDILGPRGPLTFGQVFSGAQQKAPLALIDLNALLKPAKGQQFAAIAFMTKKDLFAFLPGKNSNPLISYNGSFIAPPIVP